MTRNKPTHAVLIDLKKAFDSVNREQVFGILDTTTVPGNIKDILKALNGTETSHLLLHGEPQAAFQVTKWVRQGACSSPILFNLVMQELTYKLHSSSKCLRMTTQVVHCLP